MNSSYWFFFIGAITFYLHTMYELVYNRDDFFYTFIIAIICHGFYSVLDKLKKK